MEPLKIARVAKSVALLGFLLPWALVSCQGQPVAKANGLSLALGHLTVAGNAQSTPVDWWIVLAALAIVAGLVISFRSEPERERAKWIIGTSAAAAIMCWLSITAVDSGVKKMGGARGMEGAALQTLKVEPQIGFWLTMLSLAVSGGVAFMVFQGRGGEVEAMVRKGATGLAGAAGGVAGGADDDVRFWDRMADKNDPDNLEEYLTRFPNGKFVGLAKSRLERKGVDPSSLAAAAPEAGAAESAPEKKAAVDDCRACEAKVQPGDLFCGACGASVAA
jgi:hypothetical protein